jgi:hypothetical protein
MAFNITIGQPQPNGLVIVGETTLVTGTVTGLGGAEPVLVDSVTVQIGGGPPVVAHLTLGATRTFKAGVVVPGPPGPVAVSVTAHYDSRPPRTKSVPVIATEGALTGCWSSDDGMLFFLKQNGNALWWVGLDQGPGLQGQGLNVTTVFLGALKPVTLPELEAARAIGPAIIVPPVGLGILGAWADVPRGTRMRSGALVLQPQRGADGAVQFLNVSAETGGFTASRLTRTLFAPPQQEDIQSVLDQVNKNVSEGETLGNGNLKAYKDPVVVFGNVAADSNGLSMTVNRRMTDGLTYAEFICLRGGGSLDGDIDIDIVLDRDRLDGGGPLGQPNFWTDGWQPGVDPQAFLRKVNAGNGRLHLEAITFGRNASCGEPDDYGDPALMPGWQETGGDSVLINGRPLNGALQMQPIPGQDPPPLQVGSLGGKSIGVGALVRVTGALVLDCGHFRWTDPFDSCGEDDDYQNQEIHPIYAIDVIDATSRDNLTGAWGDNLGMTYYVNQVGDTVWWFGMGPFRNGSFAQVFQGVATNGTIAGSWQDVPFGAGDSGEPLQLAVDAGRLALTPTLSGSLGDRRWTKLYDAGVPSTGPADPGQAAAAKLRSTRRRAARRG